MKILSSMTAAVAAVAVLRDEGFDVAVEVGDELRARVLGLEQRQSQEQRRGDEAGKHLRQFNGTGPPKKPAARDSLVLM